MPYLFRQRFALVQFAAFDKLAAPLLAIVLLRQRHRALKLIRVCARDVTGRPAHQQRRKSGRDEMEESS
jgi:hypothetical protein